MAAAAAATVNVCTWPREIALISKPRIPSLAILDEPYASMGARMSDSGSRYNCCWIEATLHFLLADPFIRYFAANWKTKRELKDAGRFKVRGDFDNLRYRQGYLVMDILALRYKHKEGIMQSAFDDIMTVMYSELRDLFPLGKRDDGMNDISTLIVVALPALRFVLALHSSGHAVQRHFLANGTNPLFHYQQRCPSASPLCPLRQEEKTGFNVNGDPLARKNMALETDVIVIKFEQPVESINLQEWLGQFVMSKWHIAEVPSCMVGVCESRRLEKRVLATLPWMLYINKAAEGRIPIIYDAEKLVVGPTADGKFAVYKLIARDRFGSAHFSADIRIKGRLFTNWSFQSKREFTIPDGSHADKLCSFMVWQRVE